MLACIFYHSWLIKDDYIIIIIYLIIEASLVVRRVDSTIALRHWPMNSLSTPVTVIAISVSDCSSLQAGRSLARNPNCPLSRWGWSIKQPIACPPVPPDAVLIRPVSAIPNWIYYSTLQYDRHCCRWPREQQLYVFVKLKCRRGAKVGIKYSTHDLNLWLQLLFATHT